MWPLPRRPGNETQERVRSMKYKGRFGDYGGFYVPEVLIPVLEELEEAFYRFHEDEQFVSELAKLSKDYAGRPSPLYYAERFSEHVGFKAVSYTHLTLPTTPYV